jgi:MFS family permease
MNINLIITAIALFIWGVGESTFNEFLPLHLERLGANPVEIGVTLSTAGMVMTFAHIPAGYIADRFGRRVVMWVAWFFGTLAAWFMALSYSLSLFITGILLYRVTAFVSAPLNSYVTAARGKWSVARAVTFTSAIYAFGSIIGPWVGGILGERFGLHAVFFLAACLFVLSTCIILFLRPQPVADSQQGTKRSKISIPKSYWLFLGIVLLAMFAMYLPQPLTANFLENQRNLSLSQIGRLYTIANLGAAVLQLILGQLTAGVGLSLSQISVAAFTILIWRTGAMPWYMLGFFLLGGYRTGRTLVIAKAKEMVTDSNMGLAYGLSETVSSIGIILAPLAAGILYNHQPTAMYLVAFTILIVSIVITLAFQYLWQPNHTALGE